jgi:hypothetical protein
MMRATREEAAAQLRANQARSRRNHEIFIHSVLRVLYSKLTEAPLRVRACGLNCIYLLVGIRDVKTIF